MASRPKNLSEPMVKLLKDMGHGYAYNGLGCHGPLALAARVRTCNALAQRGLLSLSLWGEFHLTDAGEALANQLQDQPV